MKTFFQNLSPATRTEFCACTAAQAEQSLTPEQQQTLASGQGAPIEPAKMATAIIAPCLGAPVEELQTRACLGDKSYGNFYKTAGALASTCQCIGRGMGDYVRGNGQALMAYLIASYPDVADRPLGSILNSIDFRLTAQKMRGQCMNLYAYQ